MSSDSKACCHEPITTHGPSPGPRAHLLKCQTLEPRAPRWPHVSLRLRLYPLLLCSLQGSFFKFGKHLYRPNATLSTRRGSSTDSDAAQPEVRRCCPLQEQFHYFDAVPVPGSSHNSTSATQTSTSLYDQVNSIFKSSRMICLKQNTK